jgi:hypothetical protein
MRRYIHSAICGLVILAASQAAQAQSPVAGQPYQVPDGFTGYAGTTIAYGGYIYVLQGDGTMLLADGSSDADGSADDQASGIQAYQIPDGYAGYAAGTTLAYGGANYVIQPNGTMVLAGQSADAAAYDQGSAQVFLVPSEYAGYPVGSAISYGGANYTIGLNGTMVLFTNGPGGKNGGGWGGKGQKGGAYSSNYGKPAGNYAYSANANFNAMNPHPKVAGQPLRNPSVMPNRPHPTTDVRPRQGPAFMPGNHMPTTGFRPGQSNRIGASGPRPTASFRPAMNGPRTGGAGPTHVARRGR